MIILDSYAVLAFFRGKHSARLVQSLVEGDEDAALTVLGVSEVIDILVRRSGLDEDEAVLDLAQLGLSHPPDLNARIAMNAGLLRARHYDRRSRAISLADCVAAETARACQAPLATADGPLLDTCAAEGIAVIALPDDCGANWGQ